ncbi:MAG: transporter [Gammaproteobacteria bacterium]|nr:transporter [Gammaproteobacteria bacterium]
MLPLIVLKSLTFVCFLLIASPFLQAQESARGGQHALSLAAYRSGGSFSLDLDTNILFLPVRYEYDQGNWGFQLSVPYLEVDGPGSVLVNLGGVNRVVAPTWARKESGVGDVLTTVVYRVNPLAASLPFIDLRLDVKIPTADEQKGLGTGETDYNLQVDLSQYLGKWVVFATAGYSFRGQTELFPDLRSGAYAQLGAALPLLEEFSVGIIYDFRQAVSGFTSEIQEIGPYFSWQFDEHWTFTGLGMTGLNNASVDYSFLAQLRYNW